MLEKDPWAEENSGVKTKEGRRNEGGKSASRREAKL